MRATRRREHGEQVREFKGMVKALHRAGIEVILDVVYNHTAEGNHLGPMLSFRGVDNVSYYRSMADAPASTWTTPGPGTRLNPAHPSGAPADHGLVAVLGGRVSRRRLPLRPGLGAGAGAPRGRPALGLLRHHPPGPDALPGEADRRALGCRRGRVPGRQLSGALDGVERPLPRHHARLLAGEATGVGSSRSGSPARATSTSPMGAGRSPRSTSSPRTTASRSQDLVSYNDKHNEANLEENRDGTDDNRSWNCGVEGPTDDPEITALRDRQERNFLATLFLSQGVPMLVGRRRARADAARQQQRLLPGQRALVVRLGADERDERAARVHAAVDRASARAPGVPARRLPRGEETMGSGSPDVWWFRPDGRAMTQRNWQRGDALSLGVFLNGAEISTYSAEGIPVIDDTFLDPLQRRPRVDRVPAPAGCVRPPLGVRDRNGERGAATACAGLLGSGHAPRRGTVAARSAEGRVALEHRPPASGLRV